jgi:hypothetical protein
MNFYFYVLQPIEFVQEKPEYKVFKVSPGDEVAVHKLGRSALVEIRKQGGDWERVKNSFWISDITRMTEDGKLSQPSQWPKGFMDSPIEAKN